MAETILLQKEEVSYWFVATFGVMVQPGGFFAPHRKIGGGSFGQRG